MRHLINHSAKKIGICWIIQAAPSCYYSGMLRSNSGGSCALPSSSPYIPATHVTLFKCTDSTICAVMLWNDPGGWEAGQGGGAWKCKAKPKPHTILRRPSITTGRKDEAGDKVEEQEQGEALKSHCNQQVSKVELLSPLFVLGSGWMTLYPSPSSISITPKPRERMAASG